MRRHLPLLCTVALVAGLTAVAATMATPTIDGPVTSEAVHAYLEDPGRVAEGQVAPHTRLWPYEDEAAAVRGGQSPYVRVLDGAWKLRIAKTPGEVPGGYQEPGYDASGWPSVQVPHTWQSDFIDHPIFRNVPEEIWPAAPPKVPRDVNPTGAYLKTFDLPESWDGRQQLLRFEGVTSGYFVWVNGKYAGYDQGGYSPAEFDVTSKVRPGRNTIAVQVHRWGAGAYLEDFDQWRYAGIFRDVYVYSLPTARIQDAYVTTDLDSTYRDATLKIDAEVVAPSNDYKVIGKLHDAQGRLVSTIQGGSAVIRNPGKWSDETPTLYTLALSLVDPAGQVVHSTRQQVGFREIEVKAKQVLLNGKRVLFRGVNRAETDPQTGRHVTRAAMERDVRLMKKLHINAVRTSHYESDPYWYELADKYGLLIDDEVDIETHARESCPSNCLASKPEWQAAFHDRFVAMVERDKNHPSVVFWDTGNEAGLGAAHFAMAKWADGNEPTRLLYHQPNRPDGDAPFADVAGPRYPTPESLEKKAKTFSKPIVMGEYAHAMGNGLGNFDQFWALAWKYPSMQGGFIWDWAEQNLEQPLVTTPAKVQTFFVGKPSLVEGHQGKGVELSGLDDFVNVFRDASLDVTGGLTLDAWVKPGSWAGSFPIVTKGQQYALQQPNASTVEFRVTINGVERAVSTAVPANWRGNWHRVTGTYDGRSLTLYVDGVRAAGLEAAGQIEPGLWEVNVGRNAQTQQDQTASRLAHGVFDQIRIHSRALTADELTADRSGEALLALDFEESKVVGDFPSLGVSLSGTDGLVGTDRNLQPETVEMAWAHSPVRFSSTEPGVVTVTNERQFAPLTIDLRWAVRQAGQVIRQGSVPLVLPPAGSRVLRLPVAADNPRSLERFLDLDAVFRDGAMTTRGQFRLGGTVVAGVAERPKTGAVGINSNADTTVVSGKQFRYTLDRATGTLAMVARGKEVLQGGPELDVWRPPTSNETYGWGVADRERWNAIGLDRLQTKVSSAGTTRLPDGRARIVVKSVVAAPGHKAELSFDQTMTYTIDAGGAITFGHQVTPKGTKLGTLPYLPRLGFSLRVPESLSRFAYYGRGPEENYNDRASGTRVGVFRSGVDEQYVRYSRPQAYGNHTDTRWTSLADGRNGLVVAAGRASTVDVSVTPYDRLDRAEYDFQLPLVRNKGWVTLHVAAGETGMGETPNSTLPPYRVDPTKPRSYAVTLRPLTTQEAAAGIPGQPR